MIKKLTSILFSTRLMAILFLTFAIAMIAGTFIESKYNTDTARIWVYNAWWFEGIMLLFMMNFIGNIKRYNLLKKEKWATLMLHLSFVFIISGAFVTRYISFEGMMPIREGATENVFYSDKMYLTLFVDGEYQGAMKRRTFEKALRISPVTNNNFSISDQFADTKFNVNYENFIMGAKEVIKPDAKGSFYFKLVEAGDGGREEHFLKEGEVQNIHNTLFAFNKFTPGAINISITGIGTVDLKATIQTPFEGEFMRMADKLQGKVAKDIVQPLMMRSLYSIGDMRVVFPDHPTKGTIGYDSKNDYRAKGNSDALILKLTADGQEKTVTLIGTKGSVGEAKTVKIENIDYTFFYGNKAYTLPFSIKLNDFIAQKYPGTERSFSSFESQVTVLDKSSVFDYRIFMNNILDYKGYRFFQSSFDQDEKGTVLSVNHDYWGTLITYLGYILMIIGFVWTLFNKNSRYWDLMGKIKQLREQRKALTVLVLMLVSTTGLFAQLQLPQSHEHQETQRTVSAEHADKFGEVIVQTYEGRFAPVHTLAVDVMHKISRKDKFEIPGRGKMTAIQVFLDMPINTEFWKNQK
ncbi:cytochrome c biogenesis protein ResB, partial [uncultured Flavobacterium sp.]|uniref:cytochrome c biogenesis protein ResB n=1 Tax=uncultured Flavobacterium sp. TaxID=165435 RepID=UPI0030CA2F4A